MTGGKVAKIWALRGSSKVWKTAYYRTIPVHQKARRKNSNCLGLWETLNYPGGKLLKSCNWSQVQLPNQLLQDSRNNEFVTADEIFTQLYRRTTRLHVNFERRKRNFHDKQKNWNNKKSRKCRTPVPGSRNQSFRVGQRQKLDAKRETEKKQWISAHQQKTKTFKNLKLFLVQPIIRTIDINGSCQFKVCPNVFQLIPERLEVRGPTTLRPAWS